MQNGFASTLQACATQKINVAYLNENYLKLQAGYLFPEVARRVREFCEAHPEGARRLIRCGIGDVYRAASARSYRSNEARDR